ncbi:MAG: TIGR02757 family protein [Planctomycetota bacterium]|nr:TIGR02757 family protein [Planctomycetota bacterium]
MRAETLNRLRVTLDALLEGFPFPERLPSDPVSVLRQYTDPSDQEVAGLIASCLALGRAASIRAKSKAVLQEMGPNPGRFVRSFDPVRDRKRFDGWVHRWYKARDLVCLLWLIRQTLEKHGSLQQCFLHGCRGESRDVGPAIERFVEEIRSGEIEPVYRKGERSGHWRSLLPSPRSGSACKRINLYLRWMVRPDDGIDVGAWQGVSPAVLVIPIDIHTSRIARHLKLTTRKSPGWAMAMEVTRVLRRLDPADPVKYDFLLCHLGMIGRCPWDRDLAACPGCRHWGRCLLPMKRRTAGSGSGSRSMYKKKSGP